MNAKEALVYKEIIETNGVKIPFVPEIITPKIERPMRNNRYEGGECKALRKLLQPKDRVLELGAGVGLLSTIAALAPGVEKVIAVEANPHLIPFINETHQLNGLTNIVLLNGAISRQRCETVEFYLRADFWASSMEPTTRRFKRKVEVSSLNIDELIAEYDPTVIVCDIEGGELGLFDEANLSNVRLVVMELHPKVYGAQKEQAICDSLDRHGLQIIPENKRTTVRSFLRPDVLKDEASGGAIRGHNAGFADENGQNLQADGLRYTRFLERLHKTLTFDWYLEIGCRRGKSFAEVRSKTIAVDPVFSISRNVTGIKPELHLFQRTSDDFFESQFLEKNEIKISVAFLDGMHLFEFLLRDFIGTERNAAKDGVILLHDCCPWDHTMTTRDLNNIPDGPWTGDVWKLIPILKTYRPDLQIDVFDCKPTGLVAISNLNPQNTTLSDAYAEIEKAYVDLELRNLDAQRLYKSFKYVSAEEQRDAGFPLFHGVGTATNVSGNQKLTP